MTCIVILFPYLPIKWLLSHRYSSWNKNVYFIWQWLTSQCVLKIIYIYILLATENSFWSRNFRGINSILIIHWIIKFNHILLPEITTEMWLTSMGIKYQIVQFFDFLIKWLEKSIIFKSLSPLIFVQLSYPPHTHIILSLQFTIQFHQIHLVIYTDNAK